MEIAKAEVIYDGGTYQLSKNQQSGYYTTEIKAIKRKIIMDQKYTYYPILLRITDDAGNVTLKTTTDAILGENLLLIVREQDIFPLKFIVADNHGHELGFLDHVDNIDVDLGETNDFEISWNIEDWTSEMCDYRYMIFIPGTEYGGLIEDRETEKERITWGGKTWRGLLEQKIIEPPKGESHRIVSGEANKIIREIVGNQFGEIFEVDEVDSGIFIESYKFDRYTSLLNGLEKMLSTKNTRLKIYYKQGEGLEAGAVHLCAVPIIDWSEELEYSQDGNINFSTRDYRCGINHLICAGEGEGSQRAVIHLYVQSDGSISERQNYFGLDERTAFYSYTSVEDMEELRKGGEKRLKELMNYKQFDVVVGDIDIEINDIVGGRDRMTGMEAKIPVIGKILRIEEGVAKIEYKLKGDE